LVAAEVRMILSYADLWLPTLLLGAYYWRRRRAR
jgi:hypothetical protein